MFISQESGGESHEPVGLHINTPLLRVQAVRLQRARLAEALDLVDDLVPAVVASPRQTLGVLSDVKAAQRRPIM